MMSVEEIFSQTVFSHFQTFSLNQSFNTCKESLLLLQGGDTQPTKLLNLSMCQRSYISGRKHLQANKHYLFKEACNNSRWTAQALRKAHLQANKNSIRITGDKSTLEKDLLYRCLVGRFYTATQETAALNDVRRWACNSWKTIRKINAFAMNDGLYSYLSSHQRKQQNTS